MYYINEEMKNKVEGKEVSFTYNGKAYVRKVQELLDVISYKTPFVVALNFHNQFGLSIVSLCF